jgi:group I intron endonuclease
MAYIYSITNLINKNQYVGKTSKPNPYDRWKQHLQLARSIDNLQENNSAHSMPILRAICKHGAENFKFRVIEECKDDNVSEREIYWIEKLGTYGSGGYNATFGGDGVKRAKKDWANHPHSKPVSCYTLEGEWVRDYDSVGLAVDDVGNGKGKSPINFCIKGKTFQAFGYRWNWKGESPKIVEKRVNRRYPIYGYNKNTGEYKEWSSQADCAQELEGNRKRNANIGVSLNSPLKAKIHCKQWYLFRKEGDIVAFDEIKITPKNKGSDFYREISKKNNNNKKIKVIAIDIKNPSNVFEFNSLSEASFFVKGDGNYAATGNISKRLKEGNNWIHCYGYLWQYG